MSDLKESHGSSPISPAPEFKDEAVLQVVERGRPVTEVADRRGFSNHRFYEWARAVRRSREEPSIVATHVMQNASGVQVSLRGIDKVSGEWDLACLAMNLKRVDEKRVWV